MNRWRFEYTGLRSGAQNMAYDEALAHALLFGYGTPTIRLYGWNPAAISLGHNQNIEEIDSHKASSCGIDVVRRPTGGRAILHSNELTYSVVVAVRSTKVFELYGRINEALLFGLQRIGVPASLERSQPHFPSSYARASSVACFTSSARYEVKVSGRKLVGSAQRRYLRNDGQAVVLQHGSILIGPDHQRIVEFVRVGSEEERATLRDEIIKKTIDLQEILGRPVSLQDMTEVISDGFRQTWGIEFENETLIRQKGLA